MLFTINNLKLKVSKCNIWKERHFIKKIAALNATVKKL